MTTKNLLTSLLVLLAVAVVSCQKEPSTSGLHEDYLVYTDYDQQADFSDVETFYLPDSILVIGNADKTEYWKDADAQEIIGTVADLMESRNFVRTDDKETAQTGLQISYVERVTYFVGYDYPDAHRDGRSDGRPAEQPQTASHLGQLHRRPAHLVA